MNKSLLRFSTVIILLVTFLSGCMFTNSSNNNIAEQEKFIEKYRPEVESPTIQESYDTIVIGGEPEGVAAAVASARNGSKTLLVEWRDGLGGLLTYGKLNFLDIKHDQNGKSINQGLFTEWHELVGGHSAFDIELGKAAFYKMVSEEKNLTLSLNTVVESVQLNSDNSEIMNITLRNATGTFSVKGDHYIDATQDADFAVMSGVPYFIGGEDIGDKGRLMAVTPVIHLNGIDWKALQKAAKSSTWKFGPVEFNETTAAGFVQLFSLYKPVEDQTRLRGLNLVRIQNADGDQYYINALQIFGVNGLDAEQKQQAIAKGNRETAAIVEYLRNEMPGFENAVVASEPTELYVRETRHIKALYQLPMADIWRNRDHWDSIGYGGYPVDIQGTSLADLGTIVSNPKRYAIPLRSLVPQDVTNLLVVGRAAGYSSIAAGSARIVPTGMTAGEAAGVAAALAQQNKISFHQLSSDEKLVDQLRSTLKKQGALVDHFEEKYPYQGEWYDDAVTAVVNLGLVSGGYDNNLKLDDPLRTNHLANVIFHGLKRSQSPLIANEDKIKSLYSNSNEALLSRDEAADYLVRTFSDEAVSDNSWDQALALGLIDEALHSRVDQDRVLTKAEAYVLAAKLFPVK